jgi:hypothetical protein
MPEALLNIITNNIPKSTYSNCKIYKFDYFVCFLKYFTELVEPGDEDILSDYILSDVEIMKLYKGMKNILDDVVKVFDFGIDQDNKNICLIIPQNNLEESYIYNLLCDYALSEIPFREDPLTKEIILEHQLEGFKTEGIEIYGPRYYLSLS